jgi:transketolase
VLEGTAEAFDGVRRGGYVLREAPGGVPELLLVSSGSEVHLCLEAAALLADADAQERIAARVVSLPSWDLFDRQDAAYRDSVLPEGVPTLAVEAAASLGWERFADDVVAIDRFGASAPAAELFTHFGYTPNNVADRARAVWRRAGHGPHPGAAQARGRRTP